MPVDTFISKSPRFALACALVAFLSGCGASLHDTVARGDLKLAEAMIADNPAVLESRNKLGKTPLHYAISYKKLDAMELLLSHGADLEAADNTGMTPLHVAAMLGRKDEAAWLIEAGASLAPRDKFGDTPLHTAALWGQGHIIKLLVDHGADLSEKNAQGRTPLELARQQRQTRAADYIESLMAKGAQ